MTVAIYSYRRTAVKTHLQTVCSHPSWNNYQEVPSTVPPCHRSRADWL